MTGSIFVPGRLRRLATRVLVLALLPMNVWSKTALSVSSRPLTNTGPIWTMGGRCMMVCMSEQLGLAAEFDCVTELVTGDGSRSKKSGADNACWGYERSFRAIAQAVDSPKGREAATICGQRCERSEADELRSKIKMRLAVVYTAEKAFFAEFDTYTTDLKALGVAFDEYPAAVKVGFLEPMASAPAIEMGTVGHDPKRMNSDALAAMGDRAHGLTPDAEISKTPMNELKRYCNACTATPRRFVAIAAAKLKGKIEVYTIDEGKNIVKVHGDFDR